MTTFLLGVVFIVGPILLLAVTTFGIMYLGAVLRRDPELLEARAQRRAKREARRAQVREPYGPNAEADRAGSLG